MKEEYEKLTLKVYDTSKFGKKTPGHMIITDEFKDDRWGGDPHSINTYQFILDCTVRSMVSTRNRIENLSCMPIFMYRGEDITSQLLPCFLQDLEYFFGDFNFTSRRGQRELGSLNYLKEYGCIGEIE